MFRLKENFIWKRNYFIYFWEDIVLKSLSLFRILKETMEEWTFVSKEKLVWKGFKKTSILQIVSKYTSHIWDLSKLFKDDKMVWAMLLSESLSRMILQSLVLWLMKSFESLLKLIYDFVFIKKEKGWAL